MKKSLLFLAAFALFCSMQKTLGQVINPGFETWTNDLLVPMAMNPNSGNNTFGWWNFNFFNSSIVGSSPISMVRSSDTVHSGSYAVRLETKVYTPTSWNIYKNWGIPFIGHEYNDTLGILFNGKVNMTNQTYNPGIPFTQSISQFKLYYQYHPNGNDTAECRVALLSGGTPVAGGAFKTGGTTTGWQQVTIDMVYLNGLTPDTMYVLISSSSLDYSPKEGSVLWIDDVSVVLPSGIDQPLGDVHRISIFPNPSSGRFRIQANNIEKVEVLDLQGKQLYFGTENEIDISKCPQGIYLVKVTTNQEVITRKLIKK